MQGSSALHPAALHSVKDPEQAPLKGAGHVIGTTRGTCRQDSSAIRALLYNL